MLCVKVTTAGTCSVGDYEIQLKLGEDRCGVILVEQDVSIKRVTLNMM